MGLSIIIVGRVGVRLVNKRILMQVFNHDDKTLDGKKMMSTPSKCDGVSFSFIELHLRVRFNFIEQRGLDKKLVF